MTITVEIPQDNYYGVDGTCDYTNCGAESVSLYYGYSIENDNTVSVFIAEYCNHHKENHAEKSEKMWFVGNIQ